MTTSDPKDRVPCTYEDIALINRVFSSRPRSNTPVEGIDKPTPRHRGGSWLSALLLKARAYLP